MKLVELRRVERVSATDGERKRRVYVVAVWELVPRSHDFFSGVQMVQEPRVLDGCLRHAWPLGDEPNQLA